MKSRCASEVQFYAPQKKKKRAEKGSERCRNDGTANGEESPSHPGAIFTSYSCRCQAKTDVVAAASATATVFESLFPVLGTSNTGAVSPNALGRFHRTQSSEFKVAWNIQNQSRRLDIKGKNLYCKERANWFPSDNPGPGSASPLVLQRVQTVRQT